MLKDQCRKITAVFAANPESVHLFDLEYFGLSIDIIKSKTFIDELINLSREDFIDSVVRFIYSYLPDDISKEYILRKYLDKVQIISDWTINIICQWPNRNLFKTMCRKATHYSKWKIIDTLINDQYRYQNSYELLDYLLSKYDLKHFNENDIFDFLIDCTDRKPIFLKLLFKHGANPNQTSARGNSSWLPILGRIYASQITNFLNYGSDPFLPICPNSQPIPVPLYHYLVENHSNWLDYLESLNHSSISKNQLNAVDSWNRNILHIFVSRAKKDNFSDLRNMFYYLVDLGIDPDHRAVIEDQKKVVGAKLKGILPQEYGKTPKELLENKG